MGLASCNITKNVPEGYFLMNSNKITVDQKISFKDDLTDILKLKPNQRILGMRLKLRAYNLIDSTKLSEKRLKANEKFKQNLIRKRLRYAKINSRRIEKAKRKGKEYYTEKIIKDSINDDLLFRERIKYKFGEDPKVFDSIAFNKTNEQIYNYLRRRGYYNPELTSRAIFDSVKRKVDILYELNLGKVFTIDSVVYSGDFLMIRNHGAYIKEIMDKGDSHPLLDVPFDIDLLDEYRENFAKDMRDHSYYKYSSSSIEFIADTSYKRMGVILNMKFNKQFEPFNENSDSLVVRPYRYTKINKVFFHLSDTIHVEGNFSDYCECIDFENKDYRQYFLTKESLKFAERKLSRSQRKNGLTRNNIDSSRIIYVNYNGDRPWIKPDILELNNYLEQNESYKDEYAARSIKGLSQLGLFSSIKPIFKEVDHSSSKNYLMDVHYFLTPSKKQSIAFDNRFTTSLGLLGANASVNYVNKNIFRGAEKLSISLGGGFETQTLVFNDNDENTKFPFNTIEFGPSIKLELIGLAPFPPATLSKRHRARTLISTGYNFEIRDIFDRQVFQLNYLWKFFVQKTQIFQLGLPGASVIKLVNIKKSSSFQNQLDLLNDVFLNNAYSNQFIWQDAKATFEYSNANRKYRPGRKSFLGATISYNASFDAAGNLLYGLRNTQDTLNGQYQFLDLTYAQFVRLDNRYVLAKKINSSSSIHFKAEAGAGIPYGNTNTSLPYDYSFYAGGSNDNRGWRARSLGPGAYKYHLDTNRTLTQIGDVRIGTSIEYRFSLGSILKGAFFTDIGNIWTVNEDSREAQFKIQNVFKEMAIASGIGLRVDLEYFIVRLDLGFPIYNPAYSSGARWTFQDFGSRETYIQEGIDRFILPGDTPQTARDRALYYLPKPFWPTLHFGIGYPF